MNANGKKDLPPRRIPALITYLHPFRIVCQDDSVEWNPTIEQINFSSWDYVKLHEIVGWIDVGLPSPFSMAVCFDGALALPPIPELRSTEKAVEFFNRCLGALLLGGVYCEAITLDHFETGSMLDQKYIRANGQGVSFVNQFHYTARMKMCSVIHSVELMQPNRILLSELMESSKKGYEILNLVNELNPEFLLRGVTSLARHDWGSALSNLWIIVEELTANLWKNNVLSNKVTEAEIPGRKDQLKDNRSWSISLKHELLFQLNIIDKTDLESSFLARKARNDLVHQGKYPNKESAFAAFGLIKKLLHLTTNKSDISLFDLNLSDHALSDPFNPRHPKKGEIKYWLPIPKLPGEEVLEKEEAEQRILKK